MSSKAPIMNRIDVPAVTRYTKTIQKQAKTICNRQVLFTNRQRSLSALKSISTIGKDHSINNPEEKTSQHFFIKLLNTSDSVDEIGVVIFLYYIPLNK